MSSREPSEKSKDGTTKRKSRVPGFEWANEDTSLPEGRTEIIMRPANKQRPEADAEEGSES
jgi:hypothetical protein